MLTDKFKKNADALRYKKLFLLDMDGTIYNENSIFEGTLDFLSQIEKNGGRYIFITNNSSKSVKDYVEKVNRMGITADASHFYTSSQATAFIFRRIIPDRPFSVWEPVLLSQSWSKTASALSRSRRFRPLSFYRL